MADLTSGQNARDTTSAREIALARLSAMSPPGRATSRGRAAGFVLRAVSRPEFIGALVGVVGFQRYMRLGILNPGNVTAFIAGDWGTHMLGWLHYRHASIWHLPVGQVPGLGHPGGASLIFTDSIPVLGLLLRPLSSLLPTDFQFLGIWLLASFILQGAVGARIASIFLTSRIAIAASAGIFVATPAFLLRTVHPALTAHWIVLILICAALMGARKSRWGLVALVGVTASIQPYLWMFAIVLFGGLVLDDVRHGATTGRGALREFAIAAAGSTALFGIVGTFSSGYESGTGGFGVAGQANLLTMFGDIGWSRNLGVFAIPENQLDGSAFLGLGTILLLVFAIVGQGRKPRHADLRARLRSTRTPIFTIAAALALFVYALSAHIYIGTSEVLDLSPAYDLFRPVTERFRSSGRAVWPLMYLVITAAIAGAPSALGRWFKRPEPMAAGLLVACLAIQYFDMPVPNRYEAQRDYFFSRAVGPRVDRLADQRWHLMDEGSYEHMRVIPVVLYGCDDGTAGNNYNSGLVALLSLEAYRADLTFNSGYFSRLRTDVAESCASQNLAASEHLDPDTVYVVTPNTSNILLPSDAHCGSLDGVQVCVAAANDDPFATALTSPVRNRSPAGDGARVTRDR